MGSFTELEMREKSEVATAEWLKPILRQAAICADDVWQFFANIHAKAQQQPKKRNNEYMGNVEFAAHLIVARCREWLRTRSNNISSTARKEDVGVEFFDDDEPDTYEVFESLLIRRQEERIADMKSRRLAQHATVMEEMAEVATRVCVQTICENACKSRSSDTQPEVVALAEQAADETSPLPTFVEIRQMVKAAKMSYEEATELCRELVNTMYPNGSSSNHRHVNDIDEARLLELAEDYARAAENTDVDFLCAYIRNSKENLLARETVFVNLVLRNANPADVKTMVIKAFIRTLIKQDRIMPRIGCRMAV